MTYLTLDEAIFKLQKLKCRKHYANEVKPNFMEDLDVKKFLQFLPQFYLYDKKGEWKYYYV